MTIEPVLNAFLELRKRHVKDPVYCRLTIPERNEVGWLWRDPARSERPLTTHETFTLSLRESTDVSITWRPIFNAEISGEAHARQYALWFLEQPLVVSGGTHLSLDDFQFGEGSWDRPAADFHLVRCGTYEHNGEEMWRHPSNHARRWVRDPGLFHISENIRKRVIEALDHPLPSGEWVTIRRVFAENEVHSCVE
jgi:hypothetical protein